MLARLVGWGLCLPLYSSPQAAISIGDVIALVRSSLAARQSDSQLAKTLHKLKLRQSLRDHVIEELESQGAGPKAVSELLTLRDGSSGLPVPAPAPMFQHENAPASGEITRILGEARESSLAYSRSLPDFICAQVVRRYSDAKG